MEIHTVSELIEMLQKFDGDLPVIIAYDGRFAHTMLETGGEWVTQGTTADLYHGWQPAFPCVIIDA